MAADERMPLVGPDGAAKVAAPLHHNPRPISLRGGVKVLVGATLLYVAALASARAFPRGVKGRAPSSSSYKGLNVDESSVKEAGLRLDEEDGTTMAPGASVIASGPRRKTLGVVQAAHVHSSKKRGFKRPPEPIYGHAHRKGAVVVATVPTVHRNPASLPLLGSASQLPFGLSPLH